MNAVVSYVSVCEDAGERLSGVLDPSPSARQILDAMDKVLSVMALFRECIADVAASVQAHEDVSDDMAEAWIREARAFGKGAQRLRALNAELERVLEGKGWQPPSQIRSRHRQLLQQMADIADLVEDLAETQALAAHKPFRDRVAKALEDASASA